jgi:hypothetical protein
MTLRSDATLSFLKEPIVHAGVDLVVTIFNIAEAYGPLVDDGYRG